MEDNMCMGASHGSGGEFVALDLDLSKTLAAGR